MTLIVTNTSELDRTDRDSRLTEREKRLIRYDEEQMQALGKGAEAPTVLWRTAAKGVSAATGIASLVVRTSWKVGGYSLALGRETTLRVLGFNQTILEAILTAAGKDVSRRTGVGMRQDEADTLIERWLTSIHSTLSAASIVTSSGFFVAQTSIDWGAQSITGGLAMLNAILGSTESSRAVAAIVTLMRTELNKPHEDGSPDMISTFDLLIGVISFLFLQRNGRRKTELEWRDSGGDETVWDIVIDDRGFRADVVGTKRKNVITQSRSIVQSPIVEGPDEFALIERQAEDDLLNVALSPEDQTRLSDEEIQQRILAQLPPGSKATISAETLTLRTVKVEIRGGNTTHIEAPPGMTMVSEHLNHDAGNEGSQQTVIFRTASKRATRADVAPVDQLRVTSNDATAIESTDSNDDTVTMRASPSRRSLEMTPHQGPIVNSANRRSKEYHRENYSNGLPGPVANQKKSRKPAPPEPSSPPIARQTRIPLAKSRKERGPDSSKPEKQGVFKKALKSLSPTQSSTGLSRVIPGPSTRNRSDSGSGYLNSLSQTIKPLTKDNTRKPVFHIAPTQPPTPLMSPGRTTPSAIFDSQGSYFTVHEQRRESTYSQTDTFSVHSNESRPPSPTMSRTHLRAANSLSKTQSHTEISIHQTHDQQPDEGSLHHRRSRSFVPSLYSMGTKDSEEAIILAPKTPLPRRSIFENNEMLLALAKDGKVPGQFPSQHLVTTLRRFARFASAVYGSNFLRFMGLLPEQKILGTTSQELVKVELHHEHSSFSNYTGLPAETIIKSSFLDSQGLANTYSESFSPLIHFVSIDCESKAIVLTCRGTLGFEDLLTDMACDYADLYWQGQAYKVHRGIRDSARRLMDSAGGNQIMATLKAALEEYPDFGLVLVGHSLGGAVAAALAIMISEPAKHEPGEADAPGFVTATKPKLLPSKAHTIASKDVPPIVLPPGRPIHVYAYGPPATVSPALRIATRGLITTIINANDIVPCLSLGTLHDFRAVSRHLKADIEGELKQLKQRVVERTLKSVTSFFSSDGHTSTSAGPPPPENLVGDGLGEDAWGWRQLTEFRKLLTSEKLVPPGEVFVLESTRVFDRNTDAEASDEGQGGFRPLGRPATRIQVKFVKDVEKRFAELRFGRNMFADHVPGRYEGALDALEKGVCEEG
ncbi:hypothetical protein H2198_006983 [Neophaeococcomyces mojaviensis]|uniref:Uncharacterized protein n=1 Tax=Neophaeococcomyces mojaviensis TaxID=3383035 RepID=A0ACC3A1B6_9EURO|nr:hypothetical protein H2198_006983 [Knufia sp. JES_112]